MQQVILYSQKFLSGETFCQDKHFAKFTTFCQWRNIYPQILTHMHVQGIMRGSGHHRTKISTPRERGVMVSSLFKTLEMPLEIEVTPFCF